MYVVRILFQDEGFIECLECEADTRCSRETKRNDFAWIEKKEKD